MIIKMPRIVPSLTPKRITELLSKNEINLAKNVLPSFIKSLECNQFASNSPIEDRLRISSVTLPDSREPTLIMGVFDGHGGGTTADIVSRRLFNYIALSLYPEPQNLKISSRDGLRNLVTDLHQSPQPKQDPSLQEAELTFLNRYREELTDSANIAENLKTSFNRCDEDLSQEIQSNLTNKRSSSSQSILNYYWSAAVSGCCALVMVVHRGFGYLASAGDCRAVLGVRQSDHQNHNTKEESNFITGNDNISLPTYKFDTYELNDEHNCDNINEIRRLAASHPRSEQNTMVKNNRLLGHLMPFRAFGDFTYKWPADLIKECGITRVFGSGVIPAYYHTPPYLIAEPDIRQLELDDDDQKNERYLVIASDGLWEMFESSREVIGSIVDHSINASQNQEDYDSNCATYILRSALRSLGPSQDFGSDTEELRRMYHSRLESMLTLPQGVVRNFRDDISILVLKL